ncbi:MAG: efflux RND transporter periplasmic adaptor subunit [Sumerlaeia bacterium]
MSEHESKGRRFLRWIVTTIFGILVPLAILVGGIYGAKRLIDTAPQAERQAAKGEERARLVQVERLQAGPQQAVIRVMGLVQPAREAMIQPLVNGEIVEFTENLEPGGLVKKGEVLFRIDPTDYEIAIRRMDAQVARMRSAIDLEEGQQRVALEEFELLGEDLAEGDRGLILREPQMAEARANLDAAEAELEDARIDLRRTTVRAPFNALVIEEDVELGVLATTNSSPVSLVGTDAFWIELSVPVDELRWITLPGPDGEGGSTVRIYDRAAWGPEVSRQGRIVRFTPNVDAESRMARVIVQVDDPLALEQPNAGEPPLLLNSYVRAEIDGHIFPNAIAIDRQYVREDDAVWIMNGESRLDIRRLRVLWSGPDRIIVDSVVNPGDWLVNTNLSAPVEGMLLRSEDAPVNPETGEPGTEPMTYEAEAQAGAKERVEG